MNRWNEDGLEENAFKESHMPYLPWFDISMSFVIIIILVQKLALCVNEGKRLLK